jgi:uncharacterized phage protein (TIGR02220 family)
MANGYVKIFRKVLDNPNAANPYFLAVWSYLLLKATHKPYVMRIAGEDRTLNPGDLVCSCRQVAKFFDINKDTVNNILNTMEKDSMIRRTFHARKTVISVVKWLSYQDRPDASPDAPPDTPWDTPPDTNKKKEDRRDDIDSGKTKNASNEKAKGGSLEKARGVMAEFNQRADKNYRDHASSEHLATIRARLEDGFTVEEMIEVIDHKVKQLKGTEDECKWLNPTTLFRPKNIERNLDWARNADDIEIAKLRKEYREHEMSNPSQAADIKKKIMAIRQKNNGKVTLQS